MTVSLDRAQVFLRLMQRGFPAYGVQVNPAKTKFNFPQPSTPSSLTSLPSTFSSLSSASSSSSGLFPLATTPLTTPIAAGTQGDWRAAKRRKVGADLNESSTSRCNADNTTHGLADATSTSDGNNHKAKEGERREKQWVAWNGLLVCLRSMQVRADYGR